MSAREPVSKDPRLDEYIRALATRLGSPTPTGRARVASAFQQAEALNFTIGQRLLMGATPEELQAELGFPAEVVSEAWRVTVEQLSYELTRGRHKHTPFRALTPEELQASREECLELLVRWRDQLMGSL